MTTMDEIVRRRYQTGAYGNAHFRLAEASWLDLRATRPAPPPPPAWSPAGAMARLTSIPVVFDETVPAGSWKLVDTTTGDLLAAGPCP